MSRVRLHTPRNLNDNDTTTEFEVNKIIHFNSSVGDDSKNGTKFYIDGIQEEQFCLESTNELRKLIKDHYDHKEQFSVGNIHIGDQVTQTGVMFWWKDAKFQTGVAIGFVVGFLSSYAASWFFSWTGP